MNIIVIGAGPAGLMAAIKASSENNKVIVLEKNKEAGKKLLITGSGKCNYYNNNINKESYHCKNEKLLEKIIDYKDIVFSYLKEIGIEPSLINDYYYPVSKTSSSVLNMLLLECKSKNVKIMYEYDVNDLDKIKKEFNADKIIIATGGFSYKKTGSDGYFHEYLKGKGITVNKEYPVLTSLLTENKASNEWAGIRIASQLSLYINDELIKSELGELQLINNGISGICTFNLSRLAVESISKNELVQVSINFMPDYENIMEFLEERNNRLPGRSIIEHLESIINYKLLYILFKNNKLNVNLSFEDLTDDLVARLEKVLTNYKINISGFGDFDKAQVTRGGVDTFEVNENFELLKYKDVFTAGELLDIDADCGGYNLANAFITGYIIGEYLNDKN